MSDLPTSLEQYAPLPDLWRALQRYYGAPGGETLEHPGQPLLGPWENGAGLYRTLPKNTQPIFFERNKSAPQPPDMSASFPWGLLGGRSIGARAAASRGARRPVRPPVDPSLIQAYHFSPHAEAIIESGRLNPLSHFGSKRAANERYENVVATNRLLVPERRLENPHGAVFPVDLDMRNPLRITDYLRHDPETIAGLVDRALARPTRPNDMMPWTARSIEGPASKAIENLDTDAAKARALDDLLTSRGYDGLIYRNAYEGGGDSYIANHPGTVKSSMSGNALYGPGGSVDQLLQREYVSHGN